MEYICMICGRKKHVLREGKVMLCTRCITALGLALSDKLQPPVGEGTIPQSACGSQLPLHKGALGDCRAEASLV